MSLKSAALSVTLLSIFAALPARSAVISLITLTPDDLVFQQTAASPCVIGGPNCLNGGLPYTVAGSGGSGTEFDELSPLYLLSQVTAITLSSDFDVALDYNDTSQPQILRLFEVTYYSNADGTGVIGTDTYTGPTDLKTNNNGVGYSDFILDGFMIPVGTQSLQFHAEWFNNDGADRYFLVGGDDNPVPNPVPEPSTSLLFGAGLVAAAWLRRRQNWK